MRNANRRLLILLLGIPLLMSCQRNCPSGKTQASQSEDGCQIDIRGHFDSLRENDKHELQATLEVVNASACDVMLNTSSLTVFSADAREILGNGQADSVMPLEGAICELVVGHHFVILGSQVAKNTYGPCSSCSFDTVLVKQSQLATLKDLWARDRRPIVADIVMQINYLDHADAVLHADASTLLTGGVYKTIVLKMQVTLFPSVISAP